MTKFHKAAPLNRILSALLALALFVSVPSAGAIEFTTVRGESEGPHAVLIVPAPVHDQSIGMAKQLATLPLDRGKLTIIETNGDPKIGQVGETLARAGASGDNIPNWVWVHNGAVSESGDNPVVRIAAGNSDALGAAIEEALETKVTVAQDTSSRTARFASQGTMVFEYPNRTPVSRQQRFTREFTVLLLRETGMIPADTDFEWDGLASVAKHLIALYDADGIGGAGPRNLERIAAAEIDDVGIYRVCGEDIREGALGPAATSIFPGGSGGGIGNGLQEQGREMLREYITAGGGYIGVCAGAYFAGSGLGHYLHAIDLRHSQPWRRGGGMIEIELTPEGKALFGNDATVLKTRFNNGPVFLPEDQDGGGDPNFVTLATFKTPSTDNSGVVREEMVGQSAIGSLTYGDGRMLIISPHPESHVEHHAFVARAIKWTMGLD